MTAPRTLLFLLVFLLAQGGGVVFVLAEEAGEAPGDENAAEVQSGEGVDSPDAAEEGEATEGDAETPEEPTPTPEPTPEPTPTPTPTPTPVPYLPPLSLGECHELIERVLSYVPTVDDGSLPPDIHLDSLVRMVTSSYNYLNFRDDLHTSLIHYNWTELGEVRVDRTEGIDSGTLRFDPPSPRVSAISIDVRRGDIWLHRMRVYDEREELRHEFDYTVTPRLIRHSLPRRQVFHLWRRADVARIDTEFSRANPNLGTSPIVTLTAGTTNRPEHVKMALFHLNEARNELRELRWSRARSELERAHTAVGNQIKGQRS